MPKVSVLMPIHNTKEEYLREAIESVLNQTYKDFEYIILNNSPSNKEMDRIVKSYEDKRIRYVKADYEMGISKGRNKLMSLAKGEYYAILDHDDVCVPTRFEEEVKVLDKHPEIGVVGTLYERFPKSKGISKMPEKSEAIEEYLMEGCAVLHPSSMVRASVLKKNNIRYEEKFTPAEDYSLWCRLIGKTKFYNIQKVLMHYRWHGNNTSILQDDKRLAAVKKIHAFLQKDYPKLWKKVHQTAPYIVRGRLFDLIPILRMEIKGDTPPKWVNYLPFVKIKTKLKVK